MSKVKFNIFPEHNKLNLNLNAKTKLNASTKLMRNSGESLNASNAEADIMFLSDSLEGNKLSEYNFTDLLTEKLLMGKISDAFKPVLDNPGILSKNLKSINLNLNNGKRIKNIFSEVIMEENVEKYDSLFYETAIKGNEYKLTEKDCFRAFMVYVAMPDEPKGKNKNLLIVFLLDPYHLVCPVPFRGRTREEVAKKVFQDKKNYSNTFKQNFNNEFDNIEFIEAKNL